MSIDFSAFNLAIITISFLLAGTIKGTIGVGITTVPVGLLTVAFDLTTAMVLLLIPSFLTNLWQASTGGCAKALLPRLWPFLLGATITIWFGSLVLGSGNLALLSGVLGAVLVVYGVVNLAGFRLSIPARREAWSGPVFGIANGTLTGMTGSFVVPGVMYLQAIGLPRDALIQAMGMLFMLSSIGLAATLWDIGELTPERMSLSLGAMIPVTLGMIIGQRIRHGLSEQRFRTVFFASMLGLGAYIIAAILIESSVL